MSEVEAEVDPVKISIRVKKEKAAEEKFLNFNKADQNAIIIGDERAFTFDKIFKEDSEQKEIYESLAKPLISKLINGYNCAILAYGQTGAGKTYTMHGPRNENEDEQFVGVIDRALIQIFDGLYKVHGENGYSVVVSFIEVYNEKVYDMFSDNAGIPLKGHYKAKDVEHAAVASAEEALELLKLTYNARHVRATNLNRISSRSHAIFTVRIHINTENQQTISAFHLVDLAGSEGVRRTGHQGMALTESNHINQSLLAVGKVLQAMSSGAKVIPYRDSVLTQVLQESLNSKSYLSLLCCVSPLNSNINETKSTLRFAENAKQIKTMPEINNFVSEMKKAKTPSKYGPLKPLNLNNRYVTPGKRLFPSVEYSTIKKQQNFPNATICTPSKTKRLESGAKQLNSTVFEIPSTVVPSIQEFFHPDNFRNAIGVEHRESVASIQTVNVSSSTEVDQAPDMLSLPRFSIDVNSTPKQPTFSPLLQRIANLEKVVEGTCKKLCETMTQNQTIGMQTSTPSRENNEINVAETSVLQLDMIRKELQLIVREELQNFTKNMTQIDPLENLTIPNDPFTPNHYLRMATGGVSKVLNKQPAAEEKTSESVASAIDLCSALEDSELHESAQVFKAPVIPVVRPTTRRSQREVPNVPLRRSARLSLTQRPQVTYEPELPQKKSTSRKRNQPKVKNQQIAGYFKSRNSIDSKVTKSKHREAVLDLLNSGSIKELQVLPKIGQKTAYQIVTNRIMKGKYKTLDAIGKLPVWRGKMWQNFLEANHLN